MNRKRKLAAVAAFMYLTEKKKRKHEVWTKPWLGDYERLRRSFCYNLEPMLSTTNDFKNYVRVDPETYSMLLEKITPLIIKKDTNARLAISPKEKLSLTLSFLAEGD